MAPNTAKLWPNQYFVKFNYMTFSVKSIPNLKHIHIAHSLNNHPLGTKLSNCDQMPSPETGTAAKHCATKCCPTKRRATKCHSAKTSRFKTLRNKTLPTAKRRELKNVAWSQFFCQFFAEFFGKNIVLYFWSRLIYFRPIFGVKIGVASWVRRGQRPRPAAGWPNPTGNPNFNPKNRSW
jgi:hypothetical protein